MEEEARHALQRAAVATLMEAFYRVCLYGNVWQTTHRYPPLSYRCELGTWTGGIEGPIKTLTLTFSDTELGTMVVTDSHAHLQAWSWDLGPYQGVSYQRHSGGPQAEQTEDSGPLPDELFDKGWQALHDMCRMYVWHHELRPSGLMLTLLPPL